MIVEVRGVRCSLARARREGLLSAEEIEALEAPTELDRVVLEENRIMREHENRGRARCGLPPLPEIQQ